MQGWSLFVHNEKPNIEAESQLAIKDPTPALSLAPRATQARREPRSFRTRANIVCRSEAGYRTSSQSHSLCGWRVRGSLGPTNLMGINPGIRCSNARTYPRPGNCQGRVLRFLACSLRRDPVNRSLSGLFSRTNVLLETQQRIKSPKPTTTQLPRSST